MELNSPLIFVSGKGGVGKSMWAASVATHLARKGKRVLLVEFGETSFFGFFYNRSFNMNPVEIEPGLKVAIWNGATCLKDYIRHLVRLDKLADLFFENKVMRALIRGAPALKELAILGKATSGVRNYGPKMEYDHIIFDSYATGHFLALLRAPVGMYEAIKFGPMGEQSKSIIETLKNPKFCQFQLVSLLEELPVSETIELKRSLSSEFNSNIQVIANKSLRTAGLEYGSGSLFEENMKDNLDKQNAAFSELSNDGAVDLELPFYFTNSPQDLIDKMSKSLGSS